MDEERKRYTRREFVTTSAKLVALLKAAEFFHIEVTEGQELGPLDIMEKR